MSKGYQEMQRELRVSENTLVIGMVNLAALGIPDPVVYDPEGSWGVNHPTIPILKTTNDLAHYITTNFWPGTNWQVACEPALRGTAQEEEALSVLREVAGIVLVRANTIGGTTARMARNALQNMRTVTQASPLTQGILKEKVPAFIVSSGPSLDRNAHLLKHLQKKGIVMAATSALPVLKKHGATCDFGVLLESSEAAAGPIREAREQASHFLHDIFVNPASIEAMLDTPRTVFTQGTQAYAQIVGAIECIALNYGGSVATAALAALTFAGCEPIVVLGQDTAYTDGRMYAEGVLKNIKVEVSDEGVRLDGGDWLTSLSVPAWGGGDTVITTLDLCSFRRYLELVASSFGGPERFINASEGGARLVGWTEERLEDLLARLPDRPADAINPSAGRIKPSNVERFFADMREGVRVVRELVSKLRDTPGYFADLANQQALFEAGQGATLLYALSSAGLLEAFREVSPEKRSSALTTHLLKACDLMGELLE